MKKTIYLFSGLFAVLFTTSCKKDYTCTCTYSSNNSTNVSIDETTIKDASKHQAESNCLDLEQTYTYTYGGSSTTIISSRSCELK